MWQGCREYVYVLGGRRNFRNVTTNGGEDAAKYILDGDHIADHVREVTTSENSGDATITHLGTCNVIRQISSVISQIAISK